MREQNFQQQRLLNQPSNNQRIINLRLQKQLQFLKESKLTYKINYIEPQEKSQTNPNPTQSLSSATSQITCIVTIQQTSILKQNISIFIPKKYPFYQPLFYCYQDNNNDFKQQLAKAQRVSEFIQWVPKYKIFQIVQFLAIKIKHKNQQLSIMKHFSLYHVVDKVSTTQIIVLIALLLRVLVSLGQYSGKADWPNLGDFQAHRNWMSITINKPIDQWYQQNGLLQNIWWRIDYPPIAAYLSYFFGSIYKHIQPQSMMLQRGYESKNLKTYMRLTTLLVDLIFLFPPIYLISTKLPSNPHISIKTFSLITLLGFLLKPDLILIDHGHFQYNSLILGLILSAFYLLLNGNYYSCCVFFTIAIACKQMAVYYALAFFAALLGVTIKNYRHRSAKIFYQLLKYAIIVLLVTFIIWMPFILTGSAQYVLEAIFPVHRGLYQLKVQNFWCITDVIMKWQSLLSNKALMVICFSISSVLSIPSMFCMIFDANRKILTIGFFTISMTFFMFSFHVHQKSILLPLLMAPLLSQYFGPTFIQHLIMSGTLGMYHLLQQDGQWLQYFILMVFYIIFMESFNSMLCQMKQYRLEPQRTKTKAQKIHQMVFTNNKNQVIWKIKYLFYFIMIVLHLCRIFVSSPTGLEYLYHLLFAFYSFCFNSYALILGNAILLQILVKKLFLSRNKQLKQK